MKRVFVRYPDTGGVAYHEDVSGDTRPVLRIDSDNDDWHDHETSAVRGMFGPMDEREGVLLRFRDPEWDDPEREWTLEEWLAVMKPVGAEVDPLTQDAALTGVNECVLLLEHIRSRLEFLQDYIDSTDFPGHFNMALVALDLAGDRLTEIIVYGTPAENEPESSD